MKIWEIYNTEILFLKYVIIISKLYSTQITLQHKKRHKYLWKSLRTNISNRCNSQKDIKYSLNCFNVTKYFFRIFELTNHRRGRENSKSKNGLTLDRTSVYLWWCIRLKPSDFMSVWSVDYLVRKLGKSEGVWQGLINIIQRKAIRYFYLE